MTNKQKKVLVGALWVLTMVLAGYYGASFAASQRGVKQCQADGLTECHIEFSLWGFEAIGR